MQTYTYDPEKVIVSLGNMFLTGFSEDTKVEIEKNEEIGRAHV